MTFKSYTKKIAGREDRTIFLFALSTCIWCKKTKALLGELGLAYEYVDVDLLEGLDKDEAYDAMEQHVSSISFPSIIIDGGKYVISGYQKSEIERLAP